MQEDADIRHELTAIVRNLPAEQIKVAVLKWLGEDGDLADLEQELELEQKNFLQLPNGTAKVITNYSSSTEQPKLSPKQKAKAFREWAESHRRGLPLLSDEAISRESIYSNERL
ncbi:MAG: hypothetical protein AAF298_07400 [Cyanobacteria bacterium P01_A01_bin.40]